MRRRTIAGAALLASLVFGTTAKAGAPVLELVEVPSHLVLPLAPGTNKLLRARVIGGEAKAAWLAADGEGAPRLPLDRAADGWVVNLGDPAVARVLEGADRFRVHAEMADGTVIRSVSVGFTRPRPIARSVRVQAIVEGVPRALDPYTRPWFATRKVERIEARFAGAPPRVTARAGASEWTFAPADAHRLVLALDDERRRAWEAAGLLRIVVEEGNAFELAAIPRRLDLEGPTTLTVRQRSSASVPGSRAFLTLSVRDVTAGQVVTLVGAADGTMPVPPRSMAQGSVVTFSLEDGRYELALVRLVNVLIGDDYAEFELRPEGTDETAKIDALLRRIAASDATFLRGDTRWSGADAAAHLRRKLAQAPPGSIVTVDAFIEHIASRSSTTGEPYRVRTPDGRERPAADWLREQAAALQSTIDSSR